MKVVLWWCCQVYRACSGLWCVRGSHEYFGFIRPIQEPMYESASLKVTTDRNGFRFKGCTIPFSRYQCVACEESHE